MDAGSGRRSEPGQEPEDDRNSGAPNDRSSNDRSSDNASSDNASSDNAVPISLPPPRPNGSVLMAAMLGLANALGMEQKTEPTEMAQPAEPLDDEFGFDYGRLPPLD